MQSTFVLRQTPIILVFKILSLAIIFDVLYITISVLNDFYEDLNTDSIFNLLTYDTVIYIFLIILQIIISFFLVIKWFSDFYVVTDNNLIHKKGMIFKKEDRYNLKTIESVTYNQSFFGKLFQYGNIKMRFMGSKQEMNFYALSSPEQMIHLMTET